MEFHDVVNAIDESLSSGRSLQFVLELIRLATAGSGEQFRNPDTAAAYRQLGAQCQRPRTTCVCGDCGGATSTPPPTAADLTLVAAPNASY